MKISIIIPAHNEEKRIARTLKTYHDYFTKLKESNVIDDFELLVVLNACSDNTQGVVQEVQKKCDAVHWLEIPKGGKGYAIKAGFQDALLRDFDVIGFVDADMATHPEHFYDLVLKMGQADGTIASRYMPASVIEPKRPWIKRWGSIIFYEPLIWLLFGMKFHDLQCGAKLFKRSALERIVPKLTVGQWAFDIELLYTCKKNGFIIKEVATTWFDQEGSKLKPVRAGLRMLITAFEIRFKH